MNSYLPSICNTGSGYLLSTYCMPGLCLHLTWILSQEPGRRGHCEPHFMVKKGRPGRISFTSKFIWGGKVIFSDVKERLLISFRWIMVLWLLSYHEFLSFGNTY